MYVLEAPLDVIVLEDTVSAAEIIDYVGDGFRLVNSVSPRQAQHDPVIH